MRQLFLLIIAAICFSACQEAIDFPIFEQEDLVVLNNPIRFDQLAVGQKSSYVLIKPVNCEEPSCCSESLDTLHVEIMEEDTIGYLVRETTNRPNSAPFFFYLKYERKKILMDTLENEPSVKEYDELVAIKTVAMEEENRYQRSSIFGRLGAKLYLNGPTKILLVNKEIENTCEVFFLPIKENDPLPYTDHIFLQHSELGLTENYSYNGNNYGDILLSVHDYGFGVDANAYNYGYSLSHGIIFSGIFNGSYFYGNPNVWHLISE